MWCFVWVGQKLLGLNDAWEKKKEETDKVYPQRSLWSSLFPLPYEPVISGRQNSLFSLCIMQYRNSFPSHRWRERAVQ